MARVSEINTISSYREKITTLQGEVQRDQINSIYHKYSMDVRSDVVRSPNNGRRGWKYPLPYTREVYKLDGPRGYIAHRYGGALWEYSGDHQQGYVPSVGAKPELSTILANNALSKAMLKIKDCDFNVSVSLGEARETAELFATTATRIRKGFMSLRHGNMAGFKKVLGISRKHSAPIPKTGDAVASAWLEHAYAWTPLLGDVDNAAKSLAKRDDPPVVSARTRSKSDNTYTFIADGQTHPYVAYHCISEIQHRALCRLDFEPGNFVLAKAKSLGITNPLEVAWELLPFSFVADWFVPVGDFISCFDYATGLKFKSGSMTQTVRHYRKGSGIITKPENIANNTDVALYYMKMVRYTYDVQPSIPPPPIKNPFSTKHVADALALLASAFLSSRPIR